MANYNSNLKTWGATGAEYPNGYSYLEGEQPVDDWDNFIRHNAIEDIGHLISVTNSRIETDKGSTHPGSPEGAHLSYLTDEERLYHRDSTQGSWVGLVRLDGDTMQGELDMGGNVLSGIGSLKLDGEIDLSGNDLSDSALGVTLYDSTAGVIPLGALAESQVTVNAGSHLSGGGTISLGGSVNVSVNDDFLLNTGDTMSGELVGRRAENSRIFTAQNTTSGDKLSIRADSSGEFELVGYDSSDGAWDYAGALTYDPGTSDWDFGDTPRVNGNLIATETWVNANADVPNADYADTAGDADTVDGQNYADIQTWVNTNADVPNADYADNAGDADTVDGLHASEFASSHSDLTGISSDDHHTKYSDSEAKSAAWATGSFNDGNSSESVSGDDNWNWVGSINASAIGKAEASAQTASASSTFAACKIANSAGTVVEAKDGTASSAGMALGPCDIYVKAKYDDKDVDWSVSVTTIN